MKPRTVAILGVMFCVLLAAVLLDRTSVRQPARGDGEPLIPWRASEITALRSERAGEIVAAARSDGRWTVASGPDAWPADERRVLAGLRLVAAAVVEPSDSGPATTEFVCSIEAGGSGSRIEFGPPALSGMRSVTRNGEPGRVRSDVGDLLAPGSLRAWASTLVFPELDAGATAISLVSGEQTIRLARVGSRWGLTEPVRTAADADGVTKLIAGLIALSADSAGTPQEIDRNAAAVTVVIESSESSWRLVLDAAGAGYARLEGRGAEFERGVRGLGPARLLDRFAIDALVSRVALDLPASDVQGIEIGAGTDGTPVLIERSGRGWSADQDAADQLLGLLTSAEAATVRVESPPADAVALGLRRFGDLPAASFSLRLVGSELHVNDGAVTRVYAEASTDAVRAWLLRLGG